MADVFPDAVLERVAAVIPSECQENIVIVGSLAAGFMLLKDHRKLAVRTKDIDCVIFPTGVAILAGSTVADTLIEKGWKPKINEDYPQTTDTNTPTHLLPVVRLYPPDTTEFFVELLSVSDRKHTRIALKNGSQYTLLSFPFLSIASFRPIKTKFGIYCATPEMMALANLLEHIEFKGETMSGLIEGLPIKRCNKDLGRAVALARLSEEDVLEWPKAWETALQECFRDKWRELGVHAGDGLITLLSSPNDIDQACFTCNNGLLANDKITPEQFFASAKRLIQDAIHPLKEICQVR